MRATDWAAALSIFDERGQLAAIVEAKARPGIDLDWANDWLRFRLEHERLAGPQFVLLATPQMIYLWKREDRGYSPQPLTADAHAILAPYAGPRVDLANIERSTFEFIAGAWIEALVYGLWQPTAPDEIRMLVDSGFLETIANGRVASHSFA